MLANIFGIFQIGARIAIANLFYGQINDIQCRGASQTSVGQLTGSRSECGLTDRQVPIVMPQKGLGSKVSGHRVQASAKYGRGFVAQAERMRFQLFRADVLQVARRQERV